MAILQNQMLQYLTIKFIIEETIDYYDVNVFRGKLREYAEYSKFSYGELGFGDEPLMWFQTRLPIWTGDVTFHNTKLIKQAYLNVLQRYRKFSIKDDLSFIHFCVSLTEHEIAHGLVQVYDLSELRSHHPPIFWEIYSAFSGTNVYKQLSIQFVEQTDFERKKGKYFLKETAKNAIKLHYSNGQWGLSKESVENIIIEAELFANQRM